MKKYIKIKTTYWFKQTLINKQKMQQCQYSVHCNEINNLKISCATTINITSQQIDVFFFAISLLDVDNHNYISFFALLS